MAIPDEQMVSQLKYFRIFKDPSYEIIEVETYISDTSGKHGKYHVRPVRDQGVFLKLYDVQCSKTIKCEECVGNRYFIVAIVIGKKRGSQIYSYYDSYIQPIEE